ncbi:MAG: hypothetical protein ACK4Q4_00815 [Rhodocyclaceae bacterium]
MREFEIPGTGIVREGQAFRLPTGRQFNAGWLAGASAEDLAAIGALPVNRQARPDFDPRTHRLVEAQDGPNITYAVVPLDPQEIADGIERMANEAALAIDATAEQVRHLFVTPGSAQAMVYQAKMDEAEKWTLAGSPSPPPAETYPLIAAEIGINGAVAADVVGLWTQMEAIWRQTAAQIEAIRLGGKAAVDAAAGASDFAGIAMARDNALQALLAIAP